MLLFVSTMEWSASEYEHVQESSTFYYPCPCGDKFQITVDELLDGEGAPLANIKLKMFEYCMSLSCILFPIPKITVDELLGGESVSSNRHEIIRHSVSHNTEKCSGVVAGNRSNNLLELVCCCM